MRGIVLGLFGLNELAAEQTRDTAQLGTGAMTQAQNFHPLNKLTKRLNKP